jgi:hypothetical protein
VISYIERRIIPKITTLKEIEEITYFYSKNQTEKGELSFSNAVGMLNKIAEKAVEIAAKEKNVNHLVKICSSLFYLNFKTDQVKELVKYTVIEMN